MKAEITRRGLMVGGSAMLSGCGDVAGMATTVRQGLHFYVVNERVLMRGRVIGRTSAAFADVLAQNRQVTTVVLQDMLGPHDATAVRAMGYEVRKRGLFTALQSDSAIYGPAVDLFVSGVQRRMVSGAEIGIEPTGGDPTQRQYLNEMLGSDAFYGFALRKVSAGGIHLMTQSEIVHFGLLTAPVEYLE